jgi:anti-sigma B factor antagonist
MRCQQQDHTWSNWGRALFRIDTATGCVLVSAGGEIDMDTSTGLQDALTAAFESSPCLIVDLTQVTFLDSTALGVLLAARRRAEQAGGSMALVRPPKIVRKILAGTHLQRVFAVFDSLEQAMRATIHTA